MKARFKRFKLVLRRELGNQCCLTEDGQVIVLADEFNPQRIFRSLQRAIDHFSRYMPSDLTNENHVHEWHYKTLATSQCKTCAEVDWTEKF